MFWTYSVIALGFRLFFSGLVGWVGGASESACLIRFFDFNIIVIVIVIVICFNIIGLEGPVSLLV